MGLVTFGALVAVAAPGLCWFDSGELVAGAWHLGVSHPPGQPGWSLLARTAALLPLGSIPFRMTLLSAACGAAAVVLVVRIGRLLLGPHAPPALAFLALAAACHPMLLAQALRPEVYAPALALALLALDALLRVRRPDAPPDRRALGLAALASGLLLALHPLVGGVALVAGVAWLLGVLGPVRGLALLLPATPLLLLGLACYALLPVRTAAGAALAWGRPDSLARLLDVVTATDYRVNFAVSGAGAYATSLGTRLLEHGRLALDALGVPVALLAFSGLVGGLVRRPLPTLLLAALAVAVLGTSVTQRVFHPENPDVHGYLAVAVVAALLGAAAALGLLWRGLAAYGRARLLAAPGLVALALLPLLGWPAPVSRAATRLPRVLARAALDAVPPHGAAVLTSDHAGFGVRYLQLVEGSRPDVAVGIDSLFTSSWHLLDLKAAGPARAVPWLDDGDPRALRPRFLAPPGCGGAPGGTCRVEDPALLPPGGRPGAFAGLLYGPGSGGSPGAGAEALARLARLGDTGPEHPVLRFHARTLARHLASTDRTEAAVRVLAAALDAPALEPGPVTGARRPLQAPELPRLSRVFISSEADLRRLLADVLAASGRRRLAAGLWGGERGPETPEMGLVATRHLFLAGERVAARAAYDRLLAAHPGHRADILYNLGVFFARQGAVEAARLQLSTLVKEAPAHPRAGLARRYLERLQQEEP